MSYTESNWATSYDSKRPEYYHPDIHLNTSSIYIDNQTMLDDDRFINPKHPSFDSQGLQTIQRKISKQKIASEHRIEQTNGDNMFESSRPYNTYSTSSSLQNLHYSPHRRQRSPLPPSPTAFPSELDTVLRDSTRSRMLHETNDIILANEREHSAFHQPHTRKITKIIPKENYSLSNNRPTQPRSASASTAPSIKHESRDVFSTPNDVQRLKNVRRHEPAHVSSGPGSKTSLITPDSWKTVPVLSKKTLKKKLTAETVTKPAKTDDISKPIVEQSSVQNKQRTNKPKRDKSASKPSILEKTPAKPQPPPKVEKTKEEKKKESEKIKKYIDEKRQEHEKKMLDEKELKTTQEKERKERLEKLNEQIKKVAQQPLPPSLIKKSSASTSLPSKDLTEQKRERLLHLLGPKLANEQTPIESHNDIPLHEALLLERSFSSSSSSSESVVEIQPQKSNDQTIIRSRSEPPIQNGVINGVEGRNQNLLRWAYNLTQDCDLIENKLKYLRPDGTQPFDIIPPSHQQLKYENGNLRVQIPVFIMNDNNLDHEPPIPSKILRPSGRLSHLNQNLPSEYQDHQLPGVGNLRDPLLERRIKRDHAATKIQAAYRSYTVRKSLHWSNEKQHRLNSDFNKRPIRKPTKFSSYATDLPATKLDFRFSDDNFTIGSTLLRHYQRNGTDIISSKNPSISEKSQRQRKLQKPTTLQTYSDDYENTASTISPTPINHKQIPQKPRVIQQPIPTLLESESTVSSTSSSSSSSSSVTPTQASTSTSKPQTPSNIQRRRSISPPLPPQMSPDNGRLIHHHQPPPPPSTTTSHRTVDERRYSPDALARQLNAELHLLDGVEASMKQVDNMERLRSVALAQQEVVSLAQVLNNKPSADTIPQQQLQKSTTTRQISSSPSSSTTSNRKPRSSSPQQSISTTKHSRHRPTPSSSSPSSSSSESILTAREKRVRQKFHSETELQAYEKRLKDVEKKIRLLVKRDNNSEDNDYKQSESILNAFEILDEKRNVPSPRVKPKSSNESSISEDLPVSHKSSTSTSSAIHRKTTNDTSEIRTETIRKDSDSSSISVHKEQTETVTTDASDIERRISAYHEQLKTRKTELDRLKQRKNKDDLRRQEDQLKKQLQTYDHEIEALRLQPASPKIQEEQKISVPPRITPVKSISSSSTSSISTATKPQESSIAEDLPVTESQSKTDVVEKRIEQNRPTLKKERDFFDDDDDDEEEKELKSKPLETPREERDTQYDAQSLSIATDLAASSETDSNNSRRPSTDIEKSILNLNAKLSPPSKSNEASESSSTTSEKSSKKQVQSRSSERRSSPIANDYEEDFSEVSHSPVTPIKEPLPEAKVIDIDNESIQEDIEDKQSLHDANHSLTSKSSGDEQSEILVLVKKSANTTPRRQDDKTLEEEPFFPLPLPFVPTVQPKIDSNYNDDTSHDVSEDEENNERVEQENKVDRLTDSFIRVFIDEAIDQGKQIQRLKKDSFTQEIDQKKTYVTEDTNEWILDDHSIDEDNPQVIQPNEFTLDFSQLDEKNPDEPRVESPRKIVIEEPVKILVPHTHEQVVQICHQAIDILFNQNTDFSNRSTIKCEIPDQYFTYDEQDSDNEDIRLNRHAYCRMIFDLCVELLHEMYTENIQPVKYPDWQKAKLMPKRFYRGKKPENRHDVEQVIQTKILEILSLTTRQTTYSKWRISNGRRNGIDKFETVLDEEIRRSESQWINYDDDCLQMKFDIADLILDQLVQESITECFNVINKHLTLSSNSTRL